MTKRIALFSTGLPDPSQGGSGIFNYLMCRELLAKGILEKAFFRVNDAFVKDHCNTKHLDALAAAGLKYEFVGERIYRLPLTYGPWLLLRNHQYAVCRDTVRAIARTPHNFTGCISLDLGWALALNEMPGPKVCILGDPLRPRLEHGQAVFHTRASSWRAWLQLQSLRGSDLVLKRLKGRCIVGSLSALHAAELRAMGLDARHFRFFTPEVVEKGSTRTSSRRSRLVALHVGNLATTASQSMVDYWMSDLLPELARLPVELELRFIGTVYKPFESRWPNITLTFLGHMEDLDAEFARADVFLSPMKYPVGVRTRIITALSHGTPVIADVSAALGMPELEDRVDILYGSSPVEVRRLFEQSLADPELLPRIGANARQAWERLFHPTRNVEVIVNALDSAPV